MKMIQKLSGGLFALLLMTACGVTLTAAEATNAPPRKVAPRLPEAGSAPAGTNAPVVHNSYTGRIIRLDPTANTLTLSTSYGSKNIRFSPSTLSKASGVPVKASDFKIGEFLVVRGHQERDGFYAAEFASNRLPAPTMKPAVKKEQQAPDKK